MKRIQVDHIDPPRALNNKRRIKMGKVVKNEPKSQLEFEVHNRDMNNLRDGVMSCYEYLREFGQMLVDVKDSLIDDMCIAEGQIARLLEELDDAYEKEDIEALREVMDDARVLSEGMLFKIKRL